MSGVRFALQGAEISTGVTKKTVIQLEAGANHRVLVDEISVSFKGIVNTDSPILVEILKQSSAGTGGDALTPKKWDSDYSETIQASGLKDIDGSTQPTDVEEVMGEEVHPQGGFTWQARHGGEIVIPGGGRLGIAITAAVSVSCKARIGGSE